MSPPDRRLSPPRQALALGVTAAVMAAAVLVRRGAGPDSSSGDGEPGACLSALLEAAAAGDVSAYLDCFTGPLRRKLEAEAGSSRPPERFAESLRASVSGLKGSVTSGLERPRPGEARLEWEQVRARYNERYRVRLRREGGRWRIAELERLGRGAPAIPYGTPVFPELEGEGSGPEGRAR